jgi:hypothetical protein
MWTDFEPSGGLSSGAIVRNIRCNVSSPVRVLLLELPQLLRGILEHAVWQRRDCELLTDTSPFIPKLPRADVAPDIVILGLTAAQDATLVPGLFARWPRAFVMTVLEADGEASLYELRPSRRPMGQMSPDEIVEELGDAVRRRREEQPT